MALTAEQKRTRRASASPSQRRAEADRSKRRRDEETEEQKQQHLDRRTKRRAEIMEDAEAGDISANAILDFAAARAHAYRQRVHRAANDLGSDKHNEAHSKLASRKVHDVQRSAEQRAAKEARKLELLVDQRERALAIAKAQIRYETRKQQAEEAKHERDCVAAVMQRYNHASPRLYCSSELPCRHHRCRHGGVIERCREHMLAVELAFAKATRARSRAGDQLRELRWAPPGLVKEAVALLRDKASSGAASAQIISAAGPATCSAGTLDIQEVVPQPSGVEPGRTLPSLVRSAPIKPRPTRTLKFEPTLYKRHFDQSVSLLTGRKGAPASGTCGRVKPTPAWQRARVLSALLTDNHDEPWCCDVVCDGCIKPSLESAEPSPPYATFCCEECDFCACESCYASAEHAHRLQRRPVHV